MKRKIVFRQARVYRWMAKFGQTTSVGIAQEFGLTTTAAQKLLERLEAKGCVQRRGTGRNILWTVTGRVPEDWRGLTEGSHKALAERQTRRTPVPAPRQVRVPTLAELLL